MHPGSGYFYLWVGIYKYLSLSEIFLWTFMFWSVARNLEETSEIPTVTIISLKATANWGNISANIARQHLLANMLPRFAIAVNMLAKKKIG